MKHVINLVLVGLMGLLVYMIYNSIKEPIAFQAEKNKRSLVVSSHLENVRKAQEIYKAIKGSYAPTFADLANVLKTDSIPFEMLLSDPSDPTNPDKFIRKMSYSSAIDSMRAMRINPDSLAFIPYTDGKKFDLQTDTIEYQSTQVNVVQVATRWKEFMGEFADNRYRKYDKSYDPDKLFKFGDLNAPSLTGNWE